MHRTVEQRVTFNHLPNLFNVTAIVFLFALMSNVGYAQTPTPTPITNPDSPTVQTPSTVGRISKWFGVGKKGVGILGDSVITESSVGTIGIGTNPFGSFKLEVDGGSTFGGLSVVTHKPIGTGVTGSAQTHNGTGVSGTGGAYGVYGESVGDNDGPLQSTGVYGFTQVFNGTGVRGTAANPTAGTGVSGFGTIGMYGETNGTGSNNIGVLGFASSSSAVGVVGQNTGGGLAGRFDGNVMINGNISVTGTANLTATNAVHAGTADNATSANNANTVTNGVYVTGSYADPSWITALDGGKITGTVASATNSVNAMTASTVSVPLTLNGTGVVITATSTSNEGVGASFHGNSHNGTGIGGTGGAYGVYGESVGDNDGPAQSTGVYGFTQVLNGTGVRGTAANPAFGTGVSGFGTIGMYGETNGTGSNNIGVLGFASSSSAVGVVGQNTGGGLAGRFDGNVTITGGLNMSAAGIILKATDGSNCYRITVNDAGTLTTTLVPCP